MKMKFERGLDPKDAMNIGLKSLYIYDNGFGPRNYVCSNCEGIKLVQHHTGAFSPPYYICQSCNEMVYAPKWINL